MSTTQDGSSGGSDMRLEVLVIPVSHPGRAKEFYSGLGCRLDADIVRDNSRLIQLTPPGSGQADANWPDWYAGYMVREQAGAELPA
jgi:hypothetical protein